MGLGGANRIITVRTLIVRPVLDVRLAGPDFVDGKVVPYPLETTPPASHMGRLAEGTMRR